MWKALSVRQPWPYAIFFLGKDIENRNWLTNFRGRVAIHASKVLSEADYARDRQAILDITGSVLVPPRSQLVLGAIVGTVEIVDCVTESSSPWFFGDYGFVLKDPVLLKEPIVYSGFLSFWDVYGGVLDDVCERCGRSRDGHSTCRLSYEVGACEKFVGPFQA